MAQTLTASSSSSAPSRKLLSKLLAVIEDSKAEEITSLDVHNLSDVSDYFVIASGRSDRHVQGIARRLLDFAEEHELKPLSVEGFEKGHWVLIDLGDVVAHVFYGPLRQEYNLESLWSEAPKVSIKKRKKVLQAA